MVHLCRGTFRAIMQFCSIWALSLSCLRHLLSLVCGAKHILNLALNLLSPPLVLASSPIFSLTEMLVWTPGLCICHKYLRPCSHQFSLPGYKNRHLQTTASSTSVTSGWCTFNSDGSFRECRSGVITCFCKQAYVLAWQYWSWFSQVPQGTPWQRSYELFSR